MKKWKFYINNVEIQLDIFNFDSLKYVIGRDTDYWGYFREASIDKLIFLKQDAKTIKDFFESEGVNSENTFTIKKLNVSMSCYEDFQTGVIDFYNYKEVYNNNNKLLKVEVDIVGNSEQQKIKTREDLDLKIGRNTSVEDQTITTISPINVKYKTRPLLHEAETNITGDFKGISITSPSIGFEVKHASCKVLASSQNIDFFQNSINDGPLDINQLSGVPITSSFVDMTQFSLFLLQNLQNQDIILNYDIRCTMFSPVGSGGGSYNRTFNNLRFRIYEADYDGVEFTNPVSIYTKTFSVTATVTIINGSGFTDISDSITFTKKSNKVYFASIDALGETWTDLFSGSIDGNLNFKYESLVEDSDHSSFLIYEVFQNLIEQMTDKTNVFQSDLFGRIDLGYTADGLASGIAVTNGLFLRNAVFSDGDPVEIEANFKDLYKTLDSIYGLSMWFDGEKINIERRADVFGTNEIELEPQEISRELFTKLLYTNIKVGNKQIKYENTNGTNEHNTILQFSSPLRIKANNLDLVTKYNTDYLGVELARRLSFQTDENVDTKYDDKVFLCTVQDVAGTYETILGTSGGFTLVEGVILPSYAGNLDFSPKRMLLNNSDLINSAFWKNKTDALRFEKSQNLAALVTQKTGEISTLVELEDLAYSEMTEAKFIPMLWNFKVSENDLWKVMNNQLDVFKFSLGCETKYGYLWKAQIQNDLGEITLIEKQT